MTERKFDAEVIVIGGGPAGMMAAGTAAQNGARVLVLEKNTGLGKKLLITGGGRCNLTNAGLADRAVLVEKFKGGAKFLFSPFSKFGVTETLAFFHSRGMLTKVEEEGRVFPVSDRSQSVFDVLGTFLNEGKVVVRKGMEVNGFETKDGKITGVRVADGDALYARRYVLATGGKSHPETGSTGDGFLWLEMLGHTVNHPAPVLVPVRTKERFVSEFMGVGFEDVKLTVLQREKRRVSARGKLLFTHFGVSGPLVLNMSRTIGEYIQKGGATLSFDLFPSVDAGTLDKKIQEVFALNLNRNAKNSLENMLPPTMVPVLLRLSGIDQEKPTNDVRREERMALVRLLKDFRLTASGLLGVDKAIVTSGGVALAEVDCGAMRSRLYQNLYLCGDILDIDRPSGGYSLQLCWTTGHVAGTAAVRDDNDE